MQVFITNEDSIIAAKELDDLRLNKQITEINQILLSYYHTEDENYPYKNHPINKHYNNRDGVWFLLHYIDALVDEYGYRFDRFHMGLFTSKGIQSSIFRWVMNTDKNFKPAYIKGQKNKNQIIDTENCYELYKSLLSNKWANDKKLPKWTKRNKPDWFDCDYELLKNNYSYELELRNFYNNMWVTNKYEAIYIKDLGTPHVRNIIKFLQEKRYKILLEFNLNDKWIKKMQNELKRREANNV